MSVILPVFLMLVVFSLMHKTQRKSDNARMATGWFMILWSICSILDAALASDLQGFDMALLQKAGGLLGYVLGCPLAWGLSKAFAIVIFVVVILFSLLMITHTRVDEIPDKVCSLMSRFGFSANKADDDETEQFPNEVRIGDATLSFAEGVPAHDGTDNAASEEKKPMLLSRLRQLISSKTKKQALKTDSNTMTAMRRFAMPPNDMAKRRKPCLTNHIRAFRSRVAFHPVNIPLRILAEPSSCLRCLWRVPFRQTRSELQAAPCRKFQKPSPRWLERYHLVKSSQSAWPRTIRGRSSMRTAHPTERRLCRCGDQRGRKRSEWRLERRRRFR